MANFDKPFKDKILLEPHKVSDSEEKTSEEELVIDDGTRHISNDRNGNDNRYYIKIVNENDNKYIDYFETRGIRANIYNMNKENIGNDKFIDSFTNKQFSKFEKGKIYEVEMTEEADYYVLDKTLRVVADTRIL